MTFLKIFVGQFRTQPIGFIINILGLAVGFAVFICAALFFAYETGFDGFFEDADKIYRLETEFALPGQDPLYSGTTMGGFQSVADRSFHSLEASAQIFVLEGTIQNQEKNFNEVIFFTNPAFFQVFPLPFKYGDPASSLKNINQVILSERKARQFFETDAAVGKTLTIDFGGGVRDFLVAGILKQLPENTHLKTEILVRLDDTQASTIFPPPLKDYNNIWGRPLSFLYFKFKTPLSLSEINQFQGVLAETLNANTQEKLATYGRPQSDFWSFTFRPLRDIHTRGYADFYDVTNPGVNLNILRISLFVGFLTLGVALINFINFLTARADLRAKEISLRKTFGAKRGQILRQFQLEAFLITFLGLILGAILAFLASPYINEIFSIKIGVETFSALKLFSWFLGLWLGAAFAGGFYPALVLSGKKPVGQLGTFRAAKGSSVLRKVLLVVQFSVAIGLVLGVYLIVAQVNFILTAERGFPDQGLVGMNLPGGSPENIQDAKGFLGRLREISEIKIAAQHYDLPGLTLSAFLQTSKAGQNDGVSFKSQSVDENFFQVFNVQPLAGRVFSPETPAIPKFVFGQEGLSEKASAVLNVSAIKALGFRTPEEAIGQTLVGQFRAEKTEFTVIGVIPDIRWETPRENFSPFIFFKDERFFYSISFRTDPAFQKEVLTKVARAWEDFYPKTPFAPLQIDGIWQDQLKQENLLALAAGLLASIAVIIALLGLFSHALFYHGTQKKNLAIRRVHGAGTLHLVIRQLWAFSTPALIAAPVAWAIVGYFIMEWLSGYAVRITPNPTNFLVSALVCIILSWLFVSGLILKNSLIRPAEILREE